MTQFAPSGPEPVSTEVVRAVWALFESEIAATADAATDEELSSLAALESDRFTPRWSFAAGGKVGSVISFEPPTFTFGGQVGFRYWGSNFVIPGAVVEVENMIQAARSLLTASLIARVEFGGVGRRERTLFQSPAHLLQHGGGDALGLQVLEVDEKSSTGLRVALGLGL
jgi:hypothetical protein